MATLHNIYTVTKLQASVYTHIKSQDMKITWKAYTAK